MHKLAVPHKAYGTTEELRSNIRSALARKLPEVSPALCAHDGTLVIVGSGPSLPAFFEEIVEERRKGRPILACNGAHDFLCERGLEPDLFLTVDPRTTIIGNTQRKNRHTVYLLASRCNPALFDHLADCKVMRWHSWSPGEECSEFSGKFAVGGGTTSGTRALYVAYVMGFRRAAIYGLDSCLAPDKLTKRFSGELADERTVVDVKVGEAGQIFYCNPPMAQQADEIQDARRVLGDMQMDFKGPGLIAAIWSERKRRGLPT